MSFDAIDRVIQFYFILAAIGAVSLLIGGAVLIYWLVTHVHFS